MFMALPAKPVSKEIVGELMLGTAFSYLIWLWFHSETNTPSLTTPQSPHAL